MGLFWANVASGQTPYRAAWSNIENDNSNMPVYYTHRVVDG